MGAQFYLKFILVETFLTKRTATHFFFEHNVKHIVTYNIILEIDVIIHVNANVHILVNWVRTSHFDFFHTVMQALRVQKRHPNVMKLSLFIP